MDEKIELPKIGDIIVEEFLEPLGITSYRLAKDLGVSTSSILDLVHNKRKISVEMALRLSKTDKVLFIIGTILFFIISIYLNF